MGSSKNVRTISQEAFDELVKENMEDLGMDPPDALQDAIETLTLQGVDLSGIVTCIPGVSSIGDNPVIQSLDRLKDFDSKLRSRDETSTSECLEPDFEEMANVLDELYDLCSIEGSGNASIATRNGGLDLVICICSKLCPSQCGRALVSVLKVLSALLIDVQSTETFHRLNGPKLVMNILNNCDGNISILNGAFSVVAAAATGNEIVKESFMDLKIEEFLAQLLRGNTARCVQSSYDAIHVLLTPDDSRVVASQVYGYARRFAEIGIPQALVGAFHEGLNSLNLVSACTALKAIAVNDEVCRLIAENGGIDAILQCIDDSGEQNNKAIARSCCSLLSKLAGSDSNKSAIVQNGGMNRLIKLSSQFSEDPYVLQEIMSIICVLSLRSPANAASAIEAGAGELAIEAMKKFPDAHQMQRQSCLMIRNLVVRNPENRKILLGNGIEKIIRKAKEKHQSCRDAATAALRDLGLDDYNT